jgi:hypothetical protein
MLHMRHNNLAEDTVATLCADGVANWLRTLPAWLQAAIQGLSPPTSLGSLEHVRKSQHMEQKP